MRAAAAAQVFVEDPASPVLAGPDVHHLFKVLRLRDGESVIAADGRGRWAPCAARRGRGEDDGWLEVDGALASEPAPAPALCVAFAPVKGDRPEWVVQKLTELGVDRIQPIEAGRSVVRWRAERAARALDRLRAVAREAAAQSRRVWLPEVPEPCTIGALVAAAAAAGEPLALAQPGGPPLSADLRCVAVGPEGGWDPAELALGPATVGLGPNVLRAETAAIAAGALLVALRTAVVGRP